MKRSSLLVGATLLLLPCMASADNLSTGSPANTFDIDQTFVQTAAGQPNQLTDFRWLPDGRLVITVKTGQVYVRPAGGGALLMAGTFLVDTESEKGLLGVAIHPQFGTTGQLIWYYSAKDPTPPPAGDGSDMDRHRVVVRTLNAQNQLGAGETVLVRNLRGPANHDGGALEVGSDGFLYIGVGDTGCNSGRIPEPIYTPTNYYGTCLADDPTQKGGGNGKILRVNIDGSIPASNPLVGSGDVTQCANACGTAPTTFAAGRQELFAWGFRNPFRIWMDPVTNKLWVGDVGEVSYEEINIVERGRHYGWPWREGRHGNPVAKCRDIRVGTNGGTPVMDQDCVEPIYNCRHGRAGLDTTVDPGCDSITGGMIVDSCNWPAPYKGRYFFGDNANGTLYSLPINAARDGVAGARENFGAVSGTPTAIRVGPDGALYYSVLQGNANPGRIVRISPKTPVACQPGMDGGVIGPTVDGAVGPTVDGAVGPTVDGAVGPTVDGGTTGDGDDSGCGCRAGARSGAPGAPLLGGLLVLGLVLVALRRRRR